MPCPRLYTDLAAWWPLFSSPVQDDYGAEADWIRDALNRTLGRDPSDILELGSGGGNIASHLRHRARLTLVDLSEEMLDVSRRLNPGVEHVRGDMRSVRLEKTFQAVLIHDAIDYMTTESDLQAAFATARAHLAPGGALIVLPDHVAETFKPGVETGGNDATDGNARGVRFIEWTHESVGGAPTYDVDYAILTREADGSVRVFHDRHTLGLFSRAVWEAAFRRAGFALPDILKDPWQRDVFIARPEP